jgi:hypothetical protein
MQPLAHTHLFMLQLVHQPSFGHRHHLQEQQSQGGKVEQQMLSQSHTHNISFKED